MRIDAAIIGGGPAGLTTGFFLSKDRVLIFEEHENVLGPQHCTSLVGARTARFYRSILGPEIVDNEYYTVVFHTPRGIYRLSFKEPIAYHLARPLLEEKLYEKNTAMGHEVLLGRRAKPGIRQDEILVGGEAYRAEARIIADGPLGVFSRRLKGEEPHYLVGVQRKHRASLLDQQEFHVFFDNNTPSFFQWLVPLDTDTVLIGYAEKPGRHPTPETVIEKMKRETGLGIGGLVESFGGIIPLNKPYPRIIINGNYLVGDSIPASKPYTGGGLYGIALLAPLVAEAVNTGSKQRLMETYWSFRKRLLLEHRMTRLFRKLGYWRPALLATLLYKKGLLTPDIYDKHHELILKILLHPWYLIEALLY